MLGEKGRRSRDDQADDLRAASNDLGLALAVRRRLDSLLESRESKVDLVIRMIVDDTRLLERVTKRFNEQGRADDNPDTFSRRLERYYEDTAPLVPLYAERGVLVEIDGMGSIEAVSAEIDAALKQSA